MEVKRAFDFIYYQLEKYPQSDCLNQKVNGLWEGYSTEEVVSIANKISLGLLKLGIGPGDKVAIVSPNRPEWNFIDLGVQQIGAVTVPMYPTITVQDYKYIFEHAEVKVVFASNEELVGKVLEATEGLNLEAIYSFDEVPNQKHWSEVRDLDPDGDLSVVKEHMSNIKEDDLLTIIYTSGTTGRPKGVMLGHKNVVSNAKALAPRFLRVLSAGQCKALSFLPLCHIYERTGIYYFMYLGVSVYYAESMETLAENIKEVKPDLFNTVPRLLEKVYDKIISKGYELPMASRKLFFWAVDLGLQYDPDKNQGWWYNTRLKIADKIIFKKWREALGDNIKIIGSGAAALQPRLARVFWAAGIKVCEGYGLTETSPVICSNAPIKGEIRIGTVGMLLDGVEVKIAEDGEILCKGPNVMQGYYKQPDLTAEVITDGWFHTGDIGVLEDGFLRITDRKKEMFKTSGGKYIAPQLMENKFKESIFIEQIMVLGEGEKFPSALVVPNFEVLYDWCKDEGIDAGDPKKLIENPRVNQLYEQEINERNADFGNWEQIKKFELLEKPWGVDSGELTPTLKLKRRIIKEKFQNLIEKIYSYSS